jgi:hypothetical protein
MKLLKASKILHVVVLLCCFLPAVFLSCEDSPSKKELEERAKVVQDSLDKIATADTLKTNLSDTALVENKRDTIIVDTTTMITTTDTIKTDTAFTESKADISTVKNTEEENEWVKDLLNRLIFPDRENLSFIGYGIVGIEASCPILFLFLLIWSAGLRFTSNNHKLIFIQTLIGFIALSIFMPDKVKDLMWGFWLVYVLSLFNAILNWRIYFDAKRNKLHNVWGDL